MKSSEKNESVVIARTKNSPVLSFLESENGKIAFVGINPNPEWSNFYLSSSFPIFWFHLIRWINKREELETKNFKSGEYISFSEEMNITTPSERKLSLRELILDEVGIYKIKIHEAEEKFSVNLLNDHESNIQESIEVETINDENFNILQENVQKEEFLWRYLIIAVLLILFVETIMYRRRGLI